MSIDWKKDKYAIAAMVSFSTILFSIALSTNGTCDDGDSIMHYLLAKYAFAHPQYFFDHWAKPFYVLVMCPFAHFGFMGAKIFNTLLSCAAVWFTYLIASALGYRWALSVFLIALFFRYFVDVTLSGLTEPLHNLMMAIAIYLAIKRRYYWAAVIVSFLPFVRSEGLFVCAAFGLYLLWIRQWRALPLLLAGHLIYSIAGYPLYGDFLWVFHKIPYAHYSSHYGHGGWLYYGIQMPAIAGVVNAILLAAGILIILFSSFLLLLRGHRERISVWGIFLMGLFILFLLMHAAFWALGIFGSFGMMRVFIAIACVMILIIVSALDYIDGLLSSWLPFHRYAMLVVLLTFYCIFGFGPSPYAYSAWDFGLHEDQMADSEAAAYIRQHYPDYKNYHLFFDACYLAEILDVDIFDGAKVSSIDMVAPGQAYPQKSLVIWDDWYSDFEHGAHLESLKNNRSLTEVSTFEKFKPKGGVRKVVLFIKDDHSASHFSTMHLLLTLK